MRKIIVQILAKSMLVLIKRYRIPFYQNPQKISTFQGLSVDLLNNSNCIYQLAYFLNSLIILIMNFLPIFISKFIFKYLISPKSNPVTKAFLFYIYHHAF